MKVKANAEEAAENGEREINIFSILVAKMYVGRRKENVCMVNGWIFMGYNICKIISEKTFVLVTENSLNRGDFSCMRVDGRRVDAEDEKFNICLVVNRTLPAPVFPSSSSLDLINISSLLSKLK